MNAKPAKSGEPRGRGEPGDIGEPVLIGRNAPCPCGSGKKYKRCCRKKDEQQKSAPTAGMDEEDLLALALDEPAEIAQSWFDVDDEERARAVFDRMRGMRPDGDDGWVLTGFLDDEEGVPFAWVRWGDGEVHVVSTTGGLLMSARDFIETYDHEHALYHARSNISDVAVTLEMLRRAELHGDEEAEADEIAEAREAARELLTTTMRCYYERWIHAPNRALDGHSPLKVAKSKKQPRLEMLYGILTLLDQHEAASPWTDDMPYDFGEVWRMLQIDRDKVMRGAADA